MKMGTNSRNHLIPEAIFSWFYPGSFFSSLKTNSGLDRTQIDPQPGLPVAPIRSISPADLAKINSGTKPTKARKQKSAAKDSNQIPPKVLGPKQPKKISSKKTKGQITLEAKHEKKNLDIDIGKINFDLSGVPSPFCSCTGMPRVCYKWGAGGWQSSCCTDSISEHPLPMSSTRPGVRMAGRKMSNGAYVKLLLKLSAEGYNLSHPLDMKKHWARHGTNKFVTIK
ncbi:PREDICTED: protein BASIC PENTACYSTEINE7-like [Populus euphratica]|uniref:GAGA-binding transcriptional activator n=1 Tax=Populus euphratica TaxID=75702 RepID=A0AAJ6TW52_POPEU|nr:PREDICTED: protein BASIC PENTACYSTEINE7-like [Populus euphratica]XP_011018448.1 PREDICTED: protein BASIC PENTACYSTEINE7-like [Populus euphratica]XP_011018449.1 PREDICTED: protein BASIC PENTACYSTEINE7-like [Populus euphratica]